MFALFALLLPLCLAGLAVSQGYYRSRRASLLRAAVSGVFSAASVISLILTPTLFYQSDMAAVEWAENAFSMFLRFALLISLFVTLTLVFSVFFGKKLRDRVMRSAVAVLFSVAAVMFTALFSALSHESDVPVYLYVRAFGIGCAALPSLSFTADEVKSLMAERKNSSASEEKNKRK